MKKRSIERFIEAQEGVYERALSELKEGCKRTHWMWYIFPQLEILGQSSMAKFYGISSENEGKEYCENELLYGRYIECCKALEGLTETNPVRIMGDIDALKLCSSLTLFYMIDEKGRELYKKLLDKFYGGKLDALTVDFIERGRNGK